MRIIDADALLAELDNTRFPGAPYVDAGISIAIGKVCDAPTVEPERKTGRWIQKEDPYGFFDTIPVCSECGHTTKMRETYNYCPNCGLPMIGGGS